MAPQGANAGDVADAPGPEPLADLGELDQAPLPATVPEPPLRALDVSTSLLAKPGVRRLRAKAACGPQSVLEAHGDVEPIQHDGRFRQNSTLEIPQTRVTIRQHGGRRPAGYPDPRQRTSERLR